MAHKCIVSSLIHSCVHAPPQYIVCHLCSKAHSTCKRMQEAPDVRSTHRLDQNVDVCVYNISLIIALQEFSKHDELPSKYIKTYTGHNPKTGQDFSCNVAYERFLGPELFFQPEIYSSDYTVPLPQVCTLNGEIDTTKKMTSGPHATQVWAVQCHCMSSHLSCTATRKADMVSLLCATDLLVSCLSLPTVA